jgi:hypothetical protein
VTLGHLRHLGLGVGPRLLGGVTDQGRDPQPELEGCSPQVVEGLSHAGRIVTTAAALLAVNFFAFGTGGGTVIQMFGIGTGVAILMDATLVRGVLVPAGMQVLGRAAWWAPRPLRRLHDRSDSARRPAPSRLPTDGGPSTRRLECTDCGDRHAEAEADGSNRTREPGLGGNSREPCEAVRDSDDDVRRAAPAR